MLLYLLKHSRPDLSNVVQELSKGMDGAGLEHWKDMLRVIKYVLHTESYGLKMCPNAEHTWELRGLSDSDFASDKEKRVSTFGYVVYFNGIPVAWRSKVQRSIVLSTTEAEYIAVAEVVKEIKFIIQVMESIGIKPNIQSTYTLITWQRYLCQTIEL